MLKKIILLMLLLAFLIPANAEAQDQTSFASVAVDLWPEFDKPSMLVMYTMTISPQVKLPAEIRLRIPARAGAPNAVANCQPDGSCFNAPFDQQPAGEWAVLIFQATSLDLRVEYYDPELTRDGARRNFQFIWPGDYPVDNLLIRVQQPVGAENMLVKPGTFSTVAADDGFTYYTVDAGPVPAGQSVEIAISYDKANDELSNSSMPVESSEPLSSETAGRTSLGSTLPIALGLLGLALIIGGGVWYWRSGRQQPQPARSRRTRRRITAGPETGGVAEGNIYCHQCGKRAAPGDRFCRACGTQLRIN